MKTSLHLNFQGRCREAFAFYEKVFGSKVVMTLTYGESPQPMPVADEAKDLVMHTSMPLGDMVLMGCDTPPGRSSPLSGFQVCVEMPEQDEAQRIFDELREGGSVQMQMAPTFWSPMFGMCTDRFGVAWMVAVPGPPA